MVFAFPLQTRFAAYTQDINIKGRSIRDKIRSAESIFIHVPGFTGAAHRIHQKQKIILVFFSTENDLQHALQFKCSIMVNPPQPDQATQNNVPINPAFNLPNQAIQPQKINKEFFFEDFATIKKITPLTQEQRNDSKSRTVQILDITLNMPRQIIYKALERYGEITELRLITVKLFQQAYVTYKSRDVITTHFSSNWSIFILRTALRVIPLTLTQEERDLRRKYALKLSGFNNDTTTHDLLPFLKDIHAKTCFIPKIPSSYRNVKYAHINFESADQIKEALNRETSFKGHQLFWSLPDAPTCFVCGNPDHVIKDCKDTRNRRSKEAQKYQRLYNKFRPAQHRKPPRQQRQQQQQRTTNTTNNTKQPSRPDQSHRPWNQNNINKPPITSSNTPPSDLEQMITAFKDLQKQINLLQYQVATVKKDIETVKKHGDTTSPSNKNLVNNQVTNNNTAPKRSFATVATSSSSATEQNTCQPSIGSVEKNQANIESSLTSITKHMESFAQLISKIEHNTAPRASIDDEIYEDDSYGYYDENYDQIDNILDDSLDASL